MKPFTRVAIVESVGMPDKIDGDVQIVRQEIGALKAAAKGEAPFEVRSRPDGGAGVKLAQRIRQRLHKRSEPLLPSLS